MSPPTLPILTAPGSGGGGAGRGIGSALAPSPEPPLSPSIATRRGTIHEDDAAAERYYADTPAPAFLPAAIADLDAFLADQRARFPSRPIVLVTSGGTTVPLEQNTVRFLDNFSAGTRGATSAEHFLRAGYAVIFMHRQYSLRPFSRHYTHSRETVFDLLSLDPASGAVTVRPELESPARALLAEYHRYATADRALLPLEFTSVHDYLFLLRAVVQRLHVHSGARAMYYLAAAVSDFFVPHAKMVEHKIQSRGGALRLELDPVPKLLRPLVRDWAPGGYIISFKLETDPALLESKSVAALERYGHQLVIGNMLKTRKFRVDLLSIDVQHPVGDARRVVNEQITLTEQELAAGNDIEALIVPDLVRRHERWIDQARSIA
ncbi:DNA/pantothenate metabolism flavoprotein [Blastocladiella britannica]|nr:DNA/pantothenate metabolism flavoprotein [Blastocladiella britannica]